MGAIELIKSDLFRYDGTISSKEFIKMFLCQDLVQVKMRFS